MQKTVLSLRERQRNEVASAIHEAAAELLLKQTWHETTVEAIAKEAGISPRTFFNYYPTKEDAALGLLPVHMPEKALEQFHTATEDLLTRTVHLIAAILNTANPHDGIRERRKQLIKKFPLLQSRFTHISMAAGDLVEPIILAELKQTETPESPAGATDKAKADHENAGHEDTAHAIRMLGSVILRYSLKKDTGILTGKPSRTLQESIDTFRNAIHL